MHPEYGIRNAQVDDAMGLAELAKKGFKGYPFESVYHPPSLAEAISNGEIRIVAALKPDLQRIIGTAVLGIDGLMAEIKRVIVDPDFRKNGLAKEMTKSLEKEAKRREVHPYTDTRADQIGMQRASLGAGLKAITVEAGKHVVYEHEVEMPGPGKKQLGPARESMIHMTSLLHADQQRLYKELKQWPSKLKQDLCANIQKALHNPPDKKSHTVTRRLPSAKLVRENILKRLDQKRNGFQVLYDEQDVTIVQYGNAKVTIIKPDASGFIETNKDTSKEEIEYVLSLSKSIGLQIVTSYENTADIKKAELLQRCGLAPAMIRPWQTEKDVGPEWQVGFRKTMNDYDRCLHYIRLDKDVRQQLEEFASVLSENIL